MLAYEYLSLYQLSSLEQTRSKNPEISLQTEKGSENIKP